MNEKKRGWGRRKKENNERHTCQKLEEPVNFYLLLILPKTPTAQTLKTDK